MTTRPVLVVGAGPVGLSAALMLARQGVASVLVERRTTRQQHPKARGVRIRTMELFRQLGIDGELRRNALPPEARRFIYCESLAGEEYGRSPPIEDEEDRHSPTSSCRVAQDSVETALMCAVLGEPSIDLRTGVEVVGLAQDGDGVDAELRSAGADSKQVRERLRVDYVIAADGVSSSVRRLLGITMEGPAALAYWQSIYWRGDIAPWTADRPCIQFMTGAKSGEVVTVASVDGRDRWVTMVTHRLSGASPSPMQEGAAVALIRRAVGSAEVAPEVIDISTWRLSSQVASRWQVNRIFLAGDAAHSFPPTGGFGMNTGVQDAHNLAWKLALVRAGRASPALLESYTEERKPVAQANADWSVANSGRFRDIAAAIAAEDRPRLEALLLDQKEHVHALAQDLGFRYRSRAVLTDNSPADCSSDRAFVPVAVAGVRAPHAWVRRNGRTISTLDLFLHDFVLLTGQRGQGWYQAGTNLTMTGLPTVTAYRIGTEIEVGPTFDRAYKLADSGALLVRPDGHVAWRTNSPPSPAQELTEVLTRLTR